MLKKWALKTVEKVKQSNKSRSLRSQTNVKVTSVEEVAKGNK